MDHILWFVSQMWQIVVCTHYLWGVYTFVCCTEILAGNLWISWQSLLMLMSCAFGSIFTVASGCPQAQCKWIFKDEMWTTFCISYVECKGLWWLGIVNVQHTRSDCLCASRVVDFKSYLDSVTVSTLTAATVSTLHLRYLICLLVCLSANMKICLQIFPRLLCSLHLIDISITE